jgi:hypothetical protein
VAEEVAFDFLVGVTLNIATRLFDEDSSLQMIEVGTRL